MKKRFVLLAVPLALLAGCAKKEAAVTQPQGTATTEPQVQTVRQTLIDSVMIDGSYWTLNDEGCMDWAAYAIPGTQVQAWSNPDTASDQVAEMKFGVVRNSDKQTRDFVHIQFDGRDLWVQDYAIALQARPAVIAGDDAYVYKTPDLSATGDRTLEEGTIVAVFDDIGSTAEYADMFRRIRLYIDDGKTYTVNGYVKQDKVSESATQVLRSQLLQKYEQVRQNDKVPDVVKAELLDNIESL